MCGVWPPCHRRAVDHRNAYGTSSALSFATPNLIRHIFPHPPFPFIVSDMCGHVHRMPLH
jgi:hypothetical protein